MAEIKSKGKALSEDMAKRHQKAVEEATKKMVARVDDALKRKEAELSP